MDATSRAKLIDERELAELTGLSVRTIQKNRRTGSGIRFRKLGSAVRYAMCDVDAYLEASVRRSTSDPGPAA